MKIKNIVWLLILATTLSKTYAYSQKVSKAKVYVPNELTAIKIAEAVWFPIYGNSIENSKPFKATLQGDSMWIVTGTAPKPYKEVIDGDTILHMIHQGVPYIEIKKCDGRIINVSHSK